MPDKNIPLHLLAQFDAFSNTGRVARTFCADYRFISAVT
jgi:hypothetical protein